jgi:predicted O-methyltransferase YrrM
MVTGVYYHAPSLVQHVPVQSAWGGGYHSAADFAPTWRSARAVHECARQPAGSDRQTILERMRNVEGWLSDEEGGLLITSAMEAVARTPPGGQTICVEIGSFAGRSTVVLGSAIKAVGTDDARLYAIDPHEGDITTLEHQVYRMGSTLDRFTRTIGEASLDEVVILIVSRSTDVRWDKPIALLFVDGLHDYESVSADFAHFGPFVKEGGFVAFHNCAVRFPGVERVVAECLAGGAYRRAHEAGSLMVLEKTGATSPPAARR